MAGKITVLILAGLVFAAPHAGGESEVLPESGTRVVVREHPATRKPYVVITDKLANGETPVRGPQGSRPDYRMLDHKRKNGEIPYDGPVSSRKKVYIFAAGLAATGIVSSVALPVAAVTGSGASGGAGAYGVAGGAVAAGTVSTAWAKSRPDPKDNYTLESQSRVIKTASDSEADILKKSDKKKADR